MGSKWAAEQLGRSEFLEAREGFSLGSHMRDGVTLNHQRRQELLVMDSEIRHLKKREAFMVTAGGWPVTKLNFQFKDRPINHLALLERDIREITHQVAVIDRKMEDLKGYTNPQPFNSISTPVDDLIKLDLF